MAEQQAEVDRVLLDIGAADVPQVLVYNKCDLLESSLQPRHPTDWVQVHAGVRRQRVFVSARDGSGLPALRDVIAQAAAGRLKGSAAPSADVRFDALLSPPDADNGLAHQRATLA